jgi:hypothetical protein
VDQKSVVGFSSGTTGHTVLTPTAAAPAVAAYALDTNARVSIVQATAGSPAAVVTETAPNGTTKDYTAAFETGEAACASGGWANNLEPGFRSEGECVSYFSSK